ncbi:MAG: ribokinase [Chloroflexota bacterium]|nr:MAG: ribokinase [Chloroflexota bacterium]
MSGTQRPRIAVFGSVNTDLIVFAPRIPAPGQTVHGNDLLVSGGGKGANQAVAAARLGAHVSMIACVGRDDFGLARHRELASEGIDVIGVAFVEDAPSGVALIIVDPTGQNAIAVSPGANKRLTAEFARANRPALDLANVALFQLENPLDGTIEAARIARDGGARVILNPAPAPSAPLPPELLALIDVLVPNEHEATALSGIQVLDFESAIASARAILAHGVGTVVVTLGDRGAVVVDARRQNAIPAWSVTAVDATGAGDTFCGALACALGRGEEIEAATRFAACAASISVTQPGARAGMPYLDDVKRALAAVDA